MTNQDIHSVGEGEQATPMVASPLRSGARRREPVILIHSHLGSAPPPVASGDAATLDDCFEPLGVAAVRVMARFTLPRMSLLPARGEGEGREQHLITRREERTDQD